jgi:hypothetical protein
MPRLFQISNRKKALAKVAWLVGIVAALGMTQASASIIQADISAEQILANLDGNLSATSSSSVPSSQQTPNQPDRDSEDSLTIFNPGAPSSNTSTSTSTSSSVSSHTAPLISFANGTAMAEDDSITSRLEAQRNISLPTPPGIDLLRPPQA